MTVPLIDALGRLDTLLGAAVEQQARRLGPASLLDPWLGMHNSGTGPRNADRLATPAA